MPMQTVYVFQPFVRARLKGYVIPGEPQVCKTEAAARRKAIALSAPAVGGIAFSRKVDPEIGEYEDARILEACGTIPPEASDWMTGAD